MAERRADSSSGAAGKAMRRALTAPVRALLPRNRWLRYGLYALPVVILLGFLQPFVDLFSRGVGLVLDAMEPLLQTTVGRIILLIGTSVVLGVVILWLLRSRIRDWRGRAWLGRLLTGVSALLGGESRKAFARLQRIGRYRGPVPAEYQDLVSDACLKCARIALQQHDADAALGWLERAGQPAAKELRRSAAQLRAKALAAQGEVELATRRAGVEKALSEFGDDAVLHGLRRDLLVDLGDLPGAADAQGMVAKHAVPLATAEERQRWLELLMDAGQAALQSGDLEQAQKLARKAKKADKQAPEPGCLAGDVLLAKGDPTAAVKAYAETRSAMGLDRIAAALRDHPGAISPRELLSLCPLKGTALLVAREYARQGDHEHARRAARQATRLLGPTPTVAAVLTEVLLLTEGEEAAGRIAGETVQAWLADSSPSAG